MSRFAMLMLFATIVLCVGCASGQKQTIINGIPFQEAGYSLKEKDAKKDPAPAKPEKETKKPESKDKIKISYPTWIGDGVLGGGAGYGETSKAHWWFAHAEGEKYWSLSDNTKLGLASVYETFDGATNPPQRFAFEGQSIALGPTLLLDRPGKEIGSQTKVRLLAGVREDEGKDTKSGYLMEQKTILLRWDVQHIIYWNDDTRWFPKIALYGRGVLDVDHDKDSSIPVGAARLPLSEKSDPAEDKTMSFLGVEANVLRVQDVTVAAIAEAQFINADASSRGFLALALKFFRERLTLGYGYTKGHGAPDIHGPFMNFFDYHFGGAKEKKNKKD